MGEDGTNASARQWQLLEEHFRHHASLVEHFKDASAPAVVLMWKTGTNQAGKRLSQFERDALVERHCELFGSWPE
jgi:hypothetical protein